MTPFTFVIFLHRRVKKGRGLVDTINPRAVRPASRPLTPTNPQQPLRSIRPVVDVISAMPPTRYYGSKRRFLPWILKAISGLEFKTALDAFGGTASVSLLFKAMRKHVTYHDGFKFNQDVASVLLADALSLEVERVRTFCAGVTPKIGVVSRNFHDVFYTDDENSWIDGFINHLDRANVNEQERSLLKHLLYQSCLKKRPYNVFHRANLALRQRTGIDRSFGNLATWNRSFPEHMVRTFEELERGLVSNNVPTNILPYGDVSKIDPGYDLVYFDPPYVSKSASKNADGYWRRYHFLEGLATYPTWEGKIDQQSKTRGYIPPRWMEDWQNKALSKDLLFGMIKRHSSSICVLSYASDAHPDRDEIQALFESTFKETRYLTMPSKYALSSVSRRELLFVGVPR